MHSKSHGAACRKAAVEAAGQGTWATSRAASSPPHVGSQRLKEPMAQTHCDGVRSLCGINQNGKEERRLCLRPPAAVSTVIKGRVSATGRITKRLKKISS